MSSFTRRLQRRRIRAKSDYEPRAQFTQMFDDGSYRTLHPTKGWQRVSAARVAAFGTMQQGHPLNLMPVASSAKPRRLYNVQKGPVPQGTITRQRCRAAARLGQELVA